MIELMLGLLSIVVPMILNFFSDKLESNLVEKQELENEIESLYVAENEVDVAVSWSNHDDKLSLLLQEADAQESKSNSC